MVEAILKWAGGKRQMLDVLTPRLPNDYNRYFEPFFGGGAVFFSLEPENGYINDVNPRLMNFYKKVKESPEVVIGDNKDIDRKLNTMSSEKDETDFYYRKRDEFNELRYDGHCKDEIREAVLFLYLNRSCWNGLYRTNEDGEFNVPIGSKQTPVAAIESQIRRGHRVLQSTEITSNDFSYIEQLVEENDLVFLDPPYPRESNTAKFNKYYEGSFSQENQKRIRELAVTLHSRGAYLLITNGPSAIESYQNADLPDDFRIQGISGRRVINSVASKRTEIGTTDMLATNIPTFDVQRTFDSFRE